MRSLVRIADHALDAQTHVIEVEGQIDLYAAPLLNERVQDVTDQGRPHLILDLSGVNFIDSAGLGVLLDALKRLRATDNALALVITDYDVERLLGITGLDATLAIFRSRDEALAAIAPVPPA